jgi:hypothetical protein
MAFKVNQFIGGRQRQDTNYRNLYRQEINHLFYTEYIYMSAFDPNLLLDSTVTQAFVKRPPIPAGVELIGTIGKVDIKSGQQKDDPSKTWIRLNIPVEFDLSQNPTVAAALQGFDKVTITDGVLLDVTDQGMIDQSPGKNGRLRRWREALGMNQDGVAFSPRAMEGRPVKCRIGQRAYEGEMYDQIAEIAKV